ncbi:hypothetical protein B0T14DRAFT_518195 [Immersiella caudata]|uniref:Secreted protein n=1 Tax=Immersiella caudata TaxID=314043 RepID=A0AA40BZ68_9PEZI|nr:hypothetical protein B0T14DRAFT_518195 [Immersiella caudata]
MQPNLTHLLLAASILASMLHENSPLRRHIRHTALWPLLRRGPPRSTSTGTKRRDCKKRRDVGVSGECLPGHPARHGQCGVGAAGLYNVNLGDGVR